MRVTDLPDLSDWQKVEVWTVDEAALLWSGIDPDSLLDAHTKFNLLFNCDSFDSINLVQKKKAKIYRRAIIEAICGGTLPFTRAIELHCDYQNGNWEKEVPFPDLPDPEKIITSRTRIQQAAFMKWVKSKNFPSYREEVRHANALAERNRIVDSTNETPHKEVDATSLRLPPLTLLNADHPLAPVELIAANEVWETVVSDENLLANGKSFKTNALEVLNQKDKFKGYSKDSKERISIVVNPNKKGGAPKTP